MLIPSLKIQKITTKTFSTSLKNAWQNWKVKSSDTSVSISFSTSVLMACEPHECLLQGAAISTAEW